MRRSKRSADCGPRPASLCSSDTEILRSLAMRSTSYSAQHFKSDTEVFLESCHRFKTDLIADQRLDRAEMCPSTVVPPLSPRLSRQCGLAFRKRPRDWKGKFSCRVALSVLQLPSLSPRIVCSCRCVVQEAK